MSLSRLVSFTALTPVSTTYESSRYELVRWYMLTMVRVGKADQSSCYHIRRLEIAAKAKRIIKLLQ